LGSVVLLWPGGPETSPGHGGRGLTFSGAVVGAGVGCGVGRGVGGAVGRGVGGGVDTGVGCGVGTGVDAGVCVGAGVEVGRAVFVAPGVGVTAAWVGLGVGPTATTTGLAEALALGSIDPVADGSLEAGPVGAEGTLAEPPEPGDSETLWGAEPDAPAADGEALAAATPPGPGLGTTTPAVNATVARMRFRSPMATTSRAR